MATNKESLNLDANVPVIIVTQATPLPAKKIASGECVPKAEEESKPEAVEQIGSGGQEVEVKKLEKVKSTTPVDVEPEVENQAESVEQMGSGGQEVENKKPGKLESTAPVNVEPEVENRGIEHNSGQRETSETLSVAETLPIGENRRTSRCSYDKFCDYYVRLSQKADTKSSLPVWLLLLALPLTVTLMGAIHLESCPHFPYIPALFLTLGIIGIVMLMARIILLYHTDVWDQHIKKRTIRVFVLVSCFITLGLYLCEFILLSELPPSGDPASKDYCNPQFTSYVLTLNWIICIFLIAFLLLTFPTCLTNYSEMMTLRMS